MVIVKKWSIILWTSKGQKYIYREWVRQEIGENI